jgi:shikimate kinase
MALNEDDEETTRFVCLIGFMGAGKTSVGRALARRMGWTFQDLDQIIETNQGKPVAAIFAGAGEAEFRRLERATLEDLLNRESTGGNTVLALGGGAFAQAHNRDALEKSGAITVLLEAPLEELRRRCDCDGHVRPLAREAARFAQLFAARRATYELARMRVDTMNKPVDQVAAEIEHMIRAASKPEVEQ